jgi:hypothetical protein
MAKLDTYIISISWSVKVFGLGRFLPEARIASFKINRYIVTIDLGLSALLISGSPARINGYIITTRSRL